MNQSNVIPFKKTFLNHYRQAIEQSFSGLSDTEKVKGFLSAGDIGGTMEYKIVQRCMDRQTEMYEGHKRCLNAVIDTQNEMIRKLVQDLVLIGQGARSDETAQQALNRLTRTAYSALIVDGTYKTVDEAFEKALKVA